MKVKLIVLLKDIESFDVSAMDKQFRVAKYALLDDFLKVSELLEDMIDNEIKVSDLEQWPLFIQYRESEEYCEFKREHKELFEVMGYKLENTHMGEEEEIIEEYGENMEII